MQLPVDILENSEISNLKSVKFPCSPYAACLLYYGPGGFAQAESEPMENVYQDLQAHRLPVVVSIITEESSKGKTMAALRALVQNFMPLDPSETSDSAQFARLPCAVSARDCCSDHPGHAFYAVSQTSSSVKFSCAAAAR